jgi:molybdate transport system regulatory protein
VDANVTASLRVGSVEFGPDDAALLRAVEEAGSLNAAAAALGRSYSRAHARIEDLEGDAGPLLERERGGSGGGGSRLTAGARDLLVRFDRLAVALEDTAETPETVFRGTVIERDGGLAVVETAAGTVRARLVEPSDRVSVTLRADAVTLYDPGGVPPEADTSARNRFSGTVVSADRRGSFAEVAVYVGTEPDLVVLVTTESADRLGLEAGTDVVATFKATATRAIAAES